MPTEILNSIELIKPKGFDIVKIGNPVLRKKSYEVAIDELKIIQSGTFFTNMIHTLDQTKGVGLAAPQVGLNARIFITKLSEGCSNYYQNCVPSELKIWINPEYEVINNTELNGIEGCLSVPGYVGLVKRPTEIKVTALNEKGEMIQEHLLGWNARVFLHEYDHLEGKVYLDIVSRDSEGRLELYENTVWSELCSAKREQKDTEWLSYYGYKVQTD